MLPRFGGGYVSTTFNDAGVNMKVLVTSLMLAMVSGSALAEDRAPETIYASTCGVCHESGLGGLAPRRGDAAAWAVRYEKGEEALIGSVNNGLNAMPAKGMCMDCTDNEFKSLIKYMAKPSS